MTTLNELAQQIHDTAKSHGFWDADRNFGEMIALAHSELSEALEEHRSGRPAEWTRHRKDCPRYPTWRRRFWKWLTGEGYMCDGLCKPEGTAVELADCIIRCLDTLHSLDVDIDGVVARKMAYNDSRPYKHGRAY